MSRVIAQDRTGYVFAPVEEPEPVVVTFAPEGDDRTAGLAAMSPEQAARLLAYAARTGRTGRTLPAQVEPAQGARA